LSIRIRFSSFEVDDLSHSVVILLVDVVLVGVLVDEEADDEDETEKRSEPENILEGEQFEFRL
jgi:regulatory protein YycI of two-component signal transduction system YycFG